MKGEAVLVIDGISADKYKFKISPRVKDEFLEKLSAADAAMLTDADMLQMLTCCRC